SDAATWVIPIVGIEGIGKTTLAQLVYNDQSLDGHFDMKIWVSLYGNFSTKKLLGEILECVTKHRCESSQMGVLQSQLRDSLCGKRYLLVLDDVWNDDHEEWDKVRSVLRCGAEGSKIRVTTRSEKVASVTSTAPPHHLEALTKDDCWTLFKQQAFAYGEEDAFSNLLPIGQQIIDKCHGVPLAAKVLGGLLRSKREEDEWLRVQESDLWNLDAGENRILSVLRLSFNDLPSHLKRCFAYCAIFPRNYHLSKEKLIQQWIAGGLVQLSAGDDLNMLEQIGNECFNNLLKVFFPTRKHYQAQVVADGDLAQTRHALVDSNNRSNLLPGALYKAHKLCTLSLLASVDTSMEALRNLVLSFRHLKILNLSGSGIKRMHRSIGDLIYLRYLDPLNTPLETLPETIGHLMHLSAMFTHRNNRVSKADTFKHKGLCKAYLAPLSYFPSIEASDFTIFIAWPDIGNLCKLNLRGELKIKHLENVTYVPRGSEGYFRDQSFSGYLEHMQLHTLGLFWGDGDAGKFNQNTSRQTRQSAAVSERLMESLQPNHNIRSLSINGYSRRQFPLWMSSDAISNLTELKLVNCKSCQTLPKLGQLPFLKCLNIQGMDNVVKIDDEFSGGGMRPFPSLNELTFRDFPELRTWESMGSTEAFPCIKRLSIIKCPFLKTMPWFPTLQRLMVQNCDPLLLRSAAELRTLVTLVIDSFRELSFIPKVLPANCLLLTSLTVISCPNLQTLPANLGKITALKSLKIGWCEMLASLPHGLENLISLENLDNNPIFLTTCLPTGMQHAMALERLTIMYCSNLASLPDGLQNLLALKSLTILSCPELASLPEGVQHMKMLQNLEIRSCPKLMALPKVNNLVSLRSLAISDSQNIKSLPEGIQQLGELQHLSIQDCPELEKRCKRGEGEDWQKISHIPYVYIGTSILQNRLDTAASSSSS
ncbi:putative disease resistance protein RGA1, partial [Durio zibethinus]|uniref:Disease resistance protein RGA1 n=1 Tax=Durio zibethinus TaxID=66656 RepID=A0A6P6AM50_DURZI